MRKSAEAFRTISEVAEELNVQKHVLRFWEVKFPQIKPLKRGGGRRFYRPADVQLLGGIRALLHADGYTIKGVQKILRERGIDYVKNRWSPDAASSPKTNRRSVTSDKSLGAKRMKPPCLPEHQTTELGRVLAELRVCRTILTAASPRKVDQQRSAPPQRARARETAS
jgi:DNA-binding transcriptional MerR regulator